MGFGLITNLSCIPTHHRYRLVVDFRWISISLMVDRIQSKAVGVFNQVFCVFCTDIQRFIISTVAGCCSSIVAVYTSEIAETLAFCLNLLYPLVSHDITK